MARWNTQEIVEAIKKINDKAIVETEEHYGDISTEQICVSLPNCDDEIFVSDFLPDDMSGDVIDDHSDCKIKFVELSDSSGGLLTEPDLAAFVAKIRAMLKKRGFKVVNSSEDMSTTHG